jgi:hypothetical protein
MGGQRAPVLLLGLILAVITVIALNINRTTFLLFAAVSTVFYTVTSFPEMPNHITLLVFCNLVILVGLPVLMLLKRPDYGDDAVFALIKPVIRYHHAHQHA